MTESAERSAATATTASWPAPRGGEAGGEAGRLRVEFGVGQPVAAASQRGRVRRPLRRGLEQRHDVAPFGRARCAVPPGEERLPLIVVEQGEAVQRLVGVLCHPPQQADQRGRDPLGCRRVEHVRVKLNQAVKSRRARRRRGQV